MHGFKIAQHVSKENPLKVVVYHGPRRHSTIFADYDVVVTSYSTMAADFAAPGTRQYVLSPTDPPPFDECR